MKITDQLYFVVPLLREGGETYAHVYSLPISVAAFDVHFNLLIRAYQMMADSGYLAFRSARRYVRAAATALDTDAAPLLNEIERLSTVAMANGERWDTIPLAQAVAQGLLEDGDGEEAVNAACFFTAAWHVPTKRVRTSLLAVGSNLWGAHTSSSPPTARTGGSPTSTSAAATAPTPPANVTTIVIPGRQAS
jgi:hypothetical protein